MTLRALAALLLLLLPGPALAWWDYGHETIARIAWSHAGPRARAGMRRLLAQAPALRTPECPARTITQLSIWADCIKPLRERFGDTAAWHYQSIPICRPFDFAAGCPDGACITDQIERHAARLADRSASPRERLIALAFLVHLVGDLHNPVHAADRDDLGGNRLLARYGVIAGRTNLHLIWDGYLMERAVSEPPGGGRGLLRGMWLAERLAMRRGTLAAWTRESWAVARDEAYGSLLPDPCAPPPASQPIVDEAMVRRLTPIVRRQIVRAGLRLARMLDEALT